MRVAVVGWQRLRGGGDGWSWKGWSVGSSRSGGCWEGSSSWAGGVGRSCLREESRSRLGGGALAQGVGELFEGVVVDNRVHHLERVKTGRVGGGGLHGVVEVRVLDVWGDGCVLGVMDVEDAFHVGDVCGHIASFGVGGPEFAEEVEEVVRMDGGEALVKEVDDLAGVIDVDEVGQLVLDGSGQCFDDPVEELRALKL